MVTLFLLGHHLFLFKFVVAVKKISGHLFYSRYFDYICANAKIK